MAMQDRSAYGNIENWKTDSREITGPEDIFVALPGYHTDGHRFIPQAVEKGAGTIVCSREVSVPPHVKMLLVPDSGEFLRENLKNRFLPDLQDLILVGVTGTNGKTTTCFLLYQMLLKCGIPSAYIGTIGFYCDGESCSIPNTTPDMLLLYKLLYRAKNAGCKVVVMEVSSHSLAERRVDGLAFDVAAFTNLTRDHLDYHKSMEAYLEAKKGILSYLKKDGSMVVNCDDVVAENFLDERACLVGTKKKRVEECRDFLAKHQLTEKAVSCLMNEEKCSFGARTSELTIEEGEKEYTCSCALPNRLNACNFLMAAVCLRELGIPLNLSLPLAEGLEGPQGRFETYQVKGGLAVVDYAHNPDAIHNVLDLYDTGGSHHMYVVLGCAGERDRGKRPMIGKMVTEKADYTVFTNDDPHAEPPEQIMDDILAGVNPDRNNYAVEYDRTAAIRMVLDRMEAGDIALILGKGHEQNIVYGDHKVPHNDGSVIRNYISEQGPA